jgi:hypothetical protein
MAKNRPGLPEGFELNLDGPVQLGDYLDEDFSDNTARVVAAKRAATIQAPPPPVQRPIPERAPSPAVPKMQALEPTPIPQPQPEPRSDSVLDLGEARRRNFNRGPIIRRPERVQLNMRPETVKMFNEIVEFVQRYSLQNDTKASEIFDAVVNMLHDAKEELSFGDVPRRGKWGTPTAKAFPTALGNAFARAIANRYAKQQTE